MGIGFSELLIMLILLFVIGAAFVAVLRALRDRSSNAGQGDRDPKQIMDERYARGEIGREDYRWMRQDIEAA